MPARIYRELTTDEVRALQAYAQKHGRTWKQALRDEWYVASSIGPLHALRNTHGPSWLRAFRLPEGER